MEESAINTMAISEPPEGASAAQYDPDYHERLKIRAEYLNKGAQALILINGGGAVALLAFLQAVWSSAQGTGMVAAILFAIVVQAFGVVAAAPIFLVNHEISMALERGDRARQRARERLRTWLYCASILFFVFGVGLVTGGTWRTVTSGGQ